MEMWNRDNTIKGLFNPLNLMMTLAFGAVAIATGIVGDDFDIRAGRT